MKPVLIALTGLLAGSLVAQTSFTSPPGYDTVDAGSLAMGWNISGYSIYLGYYPNQRFQVIDGEHAGNVRVINRIGYRHDGGLTYSSSNGGARKWTNVKLLVSEGVSHTAMSRTFAANATTTQTTVYNAATSWPDQTGKPSTSPAPWASALSFPFASAWVYTGKGDILQEYQFSGGVLGNSATWSGSTYYLDGFFVVTSMVTGRNIYGNSACNDSAMTTTSPADAAVQFAQYSKADTSQYSDKAVMQAWSQYVAPSAPVIQAIGIGTLNGTTGVSIGAKCNNLILDTSLPHILLTNTTNTSGSVSPWNYVVMGPRAQVVSVVQALSLSFWSQSAWNDSSTKQFALTRAARTTAPTGLGVTDVMPKMRGMMASSTTATTGGTPSFGYYTPVTRYN